MTDVGLGYNDGCLFKSKTATIEQIRAPANALWQAMTFCCIPEMELVNQSV